MPRPSVASSEGRWHSHREMDGWTEGEREEKMKKRRGESHWRLKHTGTEIRFGSNDIMLLIRFVLLVPAQHKFHWSHMDSGLLLNTTWCISAESRNNGTCCVHLLTSCYYAVHNIFKWWSIFISSPSLVSSARSCCVTCCASEFSKERDPSSMFTAGDQNSPIMSWISEVSW